MHATTPTPRPRRSLTTGLSAVAATAVLATTLALPAIAQDHDAPAERGDPGERHEELLAELEGLDGDADAIAEALAELHEQRMEERAERQEDRQEARDARHTERAEHGDARGPEGEGPRRQHEHQDERQGPGPRDGAGEHCPLATS